MSVLSTASTAAVEEVPQRLEDPPSLHPAATLDQSVHEDEASQLVTGHGKVRNALDRWFGGWTFMSVDQFITHAYLGDMVAFVVINPYFYAVAKRIPEPESTRAGQRWA